MTAPAIETTTLEHLDHRPRCGGKGHKTVVHAQFWVNAHDCHELLFCAKHLTAAKSTVRGMLAAFGALQCGRCKRICKTFEDFAVVVPL
ncbi:hypothetical protein [Nocardia asiatica]